MDKNQAIIEQIKKEQPPPPVQGRVIGSMTGSRQISQVVPLAPTTEPEKMGIGMQQSSDSNNFLVVPIKTNNSVDAAESEKHALSQKSDQSSLQDGGENDDSASESSLNSEDKAKLGKVLRRILNNETAEDREQLEDLIQEWVDPTPNLIEGIFYVNQTNVFLRCCTNRRSDKKDKIVVFDYRALFFLHFKSKIRMEIVNFSSSNMFENFIIFLILFNTIVLAIYDYEDRDNLTTYNQKLEYIGEVLTILFAIEMTIKIVAQGFIIHKNSYLRDVWNWLDLIVVVTGIMEMMQLSWFKVRALRTLRVLRPLRSIKAFPKMRQLVSSLIGSVNSLLNAVVFMLFIFMLFGILGIQQFQGTMYRRCRFTEEPLPDGTWPFDEELDYLCSPDGQGLMECPENRYCKEPTEANLNESIDDPFNQPLIMYSMTGFDHLGWAMLTIFQMITLEGWTIVMYNLMDSNIWWMAVLFCVLLVVIGSFFLLNVILAVLADALTMVDTVNTRQDQKRLQTIQRSLDRATKQHAKINGLPVPKASKLNADGSVFTETQQTGAKENSQSMEDLTNMADKTEAQNDKTNIQQQDQVLDEPSALQMSPPHPKGGVSLEQRQMSESKQSAPVNMLKIYPLERSNGSPDQNVQDQNQNKNNADHSEPPQQTNAAVFENDQFIPDLDENPSHVAIENLTDMNTSTGISMISVAPERAQSNRFLYICYKICTHWSFTLFITVLIIANTVVLALDQYPEDPEIINISEILNDFFTWAFVAELIIKLLGLGVREYGRDSFNIFDAFIVVLSLVDIIVTAASGSNANSGTFSAFRGVRLLRVFKLARSWNSFREILAKIIVTMKDVSTFSILLLMFMIIFSLLGMELFGHQIKFVDDRAVGIDDPNGLSPRPNFDNLYMSFASIFAISIGDDWNLIMGEAFRASGFIAIIFYPLVFIFMNLILLNLFLAILLQNFETREEPKEERDQKDQDEKALTKIKKRCNRRCRVINKKCQRKCPCMYIQDPEASETEESEDQISEIDSDGQREGFKTVKVELMDLNSSVGDSKIEFKANVVQASDGRVNSDEQIKSGSSSPPEFREMSIDRVQKNQFPIIYEEDQSNDDHEEVNKQILQLGSHRSSEKVKSDDTRVKSPTAAAGNDAEQLQPLELNQNANKISANKTDSVETEGDKRRKNYTRNNTENNIVLNLNNTKQSNQVHPSTDDDKLNQSQVGQKMDQMSIPGNQQDGNDNQDVLSDSDNEMFQNSEKLSFAKQKESLKKQMTHRKSMKLQDDKALEENQNFNADNFFQVLEQGKKGPDKANNMKRQSELLQSRKMLVDSEKHMSLAQLKRMELIEMYGGAAKNIKMIGKSCMIFSSQNFIRKMCYNIVKWAYYDSIVLILIFISTVLLTLDNPNNDENGKLAEVLKIFDYVLTILFTLECTINIILFGFVFNGKTSYGRDPWNIMDMVIVFFSIFTLVLASQGGADLSILKIFRMLRVLRPLRFLKRNLGLKIQVISLMNAVPGIVNLLLISFLIIMIFGIQAVGFLKGKLHYCDYTNVPDYAVAEIVTKWDCIDYGGEWLNATGNFDDVVTAMITMFGMITTEGWLEVMWAAVDSTQIHQVPRRNETPGFIAFFSFFMIVGSLFILNLFVGVVINTFDIEKEKLSHNNLMTQLQDEYTEVLIKCYQSKPGRSVIETGNKCRDIFTKVARHPLFEIFIFTCICLNTVVLSLSWYGMNADIIYVLEIFNYIFTVIYSFEMGIKITAMGKGYFQDGWCIFDFLIVLSAWIGILLLEVFGIDVGSISTIIRSFRIARVLKLVKSAKNLQQIFQTFILAIPELMNVGALLILFLFLFSVLGVSLFAEIKFQENLTRHANFESFGSSVLVLLRVATGEGWVDIMYDAARQPAIDFSCQTTQSYESKQKDGLQGCGSSSAYMFFMAFILVVSLVFLNLFIAIILEGFAGAATEQKIRVGDDSLEAFNRIWKKYDPFAIGLINVQEIELLVMDLLQEELHEISKDPSLQDINFNLHRFKAIELYTRWKRDMITDDERQDFFKDFEKNSRRQSFLSREMRRFISQLQIPLYYGFKQVQYHDTLNGFVRKIYKNEHQVKVLERKERIRIKQEIGEKLKKDEEMEKGSIDFFMMHPLEQEEWLENDEEDFQKVINRLENKGNEKEIILKLNFMRRLRKRAGEKLALNLDTFEGLVYDSSHIMGALVIKFYLDKKIELRRKQKALGITPSTAKIQSTSLSGFFKSADNQGDYKSVPAKKTKMPDLLSENDSQRNKNVNSHGYKTANKRQLATPKSNRAPDKSEETIERKKILQDFRVTEVSGLIDESHTLLPLIDQSNLLIDHSGEHRATYPDDKRNSNAYDEKKWITEMEEEVNSLTSRPIGHSGNSQYKLSSNGNNSREEPAQLTIEDQIEHQLSIMDGEGEDGQNQNDKEVQKITAVTVAVAGSMRDDQFRKSLPEPVIEKSRQLHSNNNKSNNLLRISSNSDYASVNNQMSLKNKNYLSKEQENQRQSRKTPPAKVEIDISTERESKQYPKSLKEYQSEIKIENQKSMTMSNNSNQDYNSKRMKTVSPAKQPTPTLRTPKKSPQNVIIGDLKGAYAKVTVQPKKTMPSVDAQFYQKQAAAKTSTLEPKNENKVEIIAAIAQKQQESNSMSSIQPKQQLQQPINNQGQSYIQEDASSNQVVLLADKKPNAVAGTAQVSQENILIQPDEDENQNRRAQSYDRLQMKQQKSEVSMFANNPAKQAFNEQSNHTQRDQKGKKIAAPFKNTGKSVERQSNQSNSLQIGNDIKSQQSTLKPTNYIKFQNDVDFKASALSNKRSQENSAMSKPEPDIILVEAAEVKPLHVQSQVLPDHQSTIQPIMQIGTLLDQNKDSTEIFRNQYVKTLNRDRGAKSIDTTVNRKLRKEAQQVVLITQKSELRNNNQSRDNSNRSLSKHSAIQKQQMTVFQNPSKKQNGKAMPAKKDMIWFSGSREDQVQAVQPEQIRQQLSPQIQKQAQRTQEGFSRKLNTAAYQKDQSKSNRHKEPNQGENNGGLKKMNTVISNKNIQNQYNFASSDDLSDLVGKRNNMSGEDQARRKQFIQPEVIAQSYQLAPSHSQQQQQQQMQSTVSNLLDSTGNLSAKKLAQFEPSGHQLQPGPFIMGTSQLNLQGQISSPNASKVRSMAQLHSNLVNQVTRVNDPRANPSQNGGQSNQNGASSSNYASGNGKRNYRSASRGTTRKNKDNKKKQLYEAYTPYNLI